MEFPQGSYIFKEGDDSNNFYLLIEGEAEAHKNIEGSTIFN
jgi:CRP-like cAMP-binding protein